MVRPFVPGILKYTQIIARVRSWHACPLLLFCLLFAQPVVAQVSQVSHHISFPDRHNQYVNVRLQLTVEGEAFELAMPNWTPGSYLIRDYSAHVERFQARGAGNRPLQVVKTAKNRWRISTEGERSPVITYAVWAGELAVNSSWVEAEFAVINGAGLFLYAPSSRNLAQTLTVELPDNWKRVHTAMLPAMDSAPQSPGFVASDFDELIDSPMLIGNAPDYRFEVLDQEYILVNQGETTLWDGAKSAQDVAAIVKSVQEFWRVNPFDRPYVFLNVIVAGTGGLEHDNSTVLLAGPWQMRHREDYIRWLALVAHEFFHAWNVRRLRPEALNGYDYEQESYTRELWMAEGLTSYYDNMLLLRSGMVTVDEFFALLAEEFHQYETIPGRLVRSAEMASFDAWIKQYKPDANTVNSVVSYYRKGALIGFVADTAIRQHSRNSDSLDTLMREMYRRYGPGGTVGRGFPPGAFEDLLEELGGAQARQVLQKLVTSTTDPDIDSALAWYGLRLERTPAKSAALAAGEAVPVDLGLVWAKSTPDLVVESVLQGGTGAQAGILPADELLAINNTRVTRENINDRMLRLVPGESVTVTLARHGRLMTLAVTTQDAVPAKYQILIDPGISRREKERMSQWLGVSLKFVEN